MSSKEELVNMFNHALELEHAARIQYLAHAEVIKGLNSEKIIERIKEIAEDELEHEKKFREIIGNYLNGEPTMKISDTIRAYEIDDILQANLKKEKESVDFYKDIYRKVMSLKDELTYEFEAIEHELRHIILDEEEHISEILLLQGK